MNGYFQQLIVSSGLIPAVPAAHAAMPLPTAPDAGIEEIVEETFASLPSPMPAPEPARFPSSLEPLITSQAPRPTPSFASTSPTTEPGTIEIVGEAIALSASLPVPRAPISVPPAPAPLTQKAPAPHMGERDPVPLPPSSDVPPPTPLSRDEIVQHVFRWVGQNPAQQTPADLGQLSLTRNPAPAADPSSTPPAPRATEEAPAPVASIMTRPTVPAQPLRAPAPAPFPTPARPTAPAPVPRPAPAASIQESSVEISIGTLQIQVEAPPAPKIARRPTAPRAPAPRLPAARPAPAIDLNRLRRGFYL